MQLFDGVRDEADLTIIHGNNKTLEVKRKMMAALLADPTAPGPIYMNEDDNGRETTTENLQKELESCDVIFEAGGSWGYMPWRMAQMFPFSFYQPAPSGILKNDMPLARRDPAYFRAVLDHIRKLVMAKP